ncbi:MAG TPA: gliding motility-associated C-terminal domain-containing protein [Cyclobacteriaceae bacterium]|nr:gliding motility-associated C-terminal domain-containing protein [Cyclobacteriaceae bacterium]
MNSLIRLFFVILFVKVTVIFSVTAQVFTTVSTGNFYDPAVWDQGTVPGPGSQVIIQHQIVADDVIVVGAGGSIRIDPQGSLTSQGIENSGEVINVGILVAKRILNKSSAKLNNIGYLETGMFANESKGLFTNSGTFIINILVTNNGTIDNISVMNVFGNVDNLGSLFISKNAKLVVSDTLINEQNGVIRLCGIVALGDDSGKKKQIVNKGTIDGCEGGVATGATQSQVINDGTITNTAYLCLGPNATYTNNNTSTGGDFKPSCCFLLKADAGPDREICAGESVRIGGLSVGNNGTGPYTFSWVESPVATAVIDLENPFVMPTISTTYVVSVTDAAGCVASDTVTVTPRTTMFVRTGGRKIICAGSSVDLDVAIACGSNNYSFQWSPTIGLDDPTKVSPVASPSTTTVYTITARDNVTGDTDSESIPVIIAPAPLVDIIPDTTIFSGDTIQFYATGGMSYRWSPNSDLSDPSIPNPLAFPKQTTVYKIEIVDRFGCLYSHSLTVTVEPRPEPPVDDRIQIFVPQLFSPNSDGVNDMLFVNVLGIQELNFRVFDRTGKLIFKTEDPSVGWDGRYEGNNLLIDTYAYVLEALTIDGEKVTQKGTVQLVR